MGRRFYGKIVSLLGSGFGAGKGGFFKNMLKLKMMSSMMSGSNVNAADGMFSGNGLAMMMLMGNGSMDGLFDGFMDDEDDDSDCNIFDKFASNDDEYDEDEPCAKKIVKKSVRKVVKEKKAR